MIFSTLTFIFIFLPLSLLACYLTPRNINAQNKVLIVLSLIFYACGDIFFLLPLILLSLINYYLAIIIKRSRYASLFFFFSVLINLSVLAFFKYLPEITDISFALTLPLGISFFTFQNISYLSDVYTKKAPVENSFSKYLLYIMFFPQMIAGPIVRYSEISKALSQREVNVDGLFDGLYLFSVGLFKKVILAGSLSAVSDAVFTSDCELLPAFYAWLGAIAFTFVIYYDFSGYSDMARGLGKMFGFNYPDNFRRPYISLSISEFFRCWHITLSQFFRDYVYIPLGGNRKSLGVTVLNTLTVFLLTGIWHGGKLTYLVWGLINGIIICLEKTFAQKSGLKAYTGMRALLRWLITFLLIVLGFVMFRSDSVKEALVHYNAMFNPDFRLSFGTYMYRFINLKYLTVFTISIVFACFKKPDHSLVNSAFAKAVCIVFLFISSVLSLICNTYQPFIYFRF